MTFSLIELKRNTSARIVEIEGGTELRKRLQNLGVRAGVYLLRIGTTSGPVVIRIGRSEVAIGRGMARRIIVQTK